MDDSYAAGLVDGEGYIGISHVKTADTYAIRVQVAMVTKHTSILRQMHARYSGRMGTRPPETERNREKDTWVVDGQEAAAFLAAVAPHLILKREAAQVALRFHEQLCASRAERGRHHWTEELRRQGEIAKRRVMELNARGPEPSRPALPRGMPVAIRRWGAWWEPNDDLFGPVEFRGPIPTSGMVISGHMYELPTPAPPTDGSESSSSPGLLPTPTVNDRATSNREHTAFPSLTKTATSQLLPTPTVSDTNGPGTHGDGGPDLRTAVNLLPTPTSRDGKGRANPDGRMRDGRERTTGNDMLPDAVARLLPTPTAMDAKASGGSTPSDVTLTDAVVRTSLGATTNPRHEEPKLLPTPAAHDSGNTPENHLRKKPGREVVTSLQVLVDYGLLSTGGRMAPPSDDGND